MAIMLVQCKRRAADIGPARAVMVIGPRLSHFIEFFSGMDMIFQTCPAVKAELMPFCAGSVVGHEYNECILVVEDNGENNWRYISFTGDSSQNPDTGDQSVVEKIEQAPEGSCVNVLMKDTTVVDKDILAAAKGKDVDVVLEMDGYSWTINGKDIDEVKDVDLKVILDTKNIPDEKITALAGDKKTKQLTLAYDGEFGFTAQLNINVGKDYAKQYGNLYWYNDGKLTFIDAGLVDENGFLSLTFTHASDYVIVFDQEAHDKKAVSSTKTGDATTMMAYAVPMVLSVLGLLLLKKRYNN